MKKTLDLPAIFNLKKMALFPLFLLTSLSSFSNPIETSWFTEYSGQYGRIYLDLAGEAANEAVITWDHPTGNDQLSPTYAGVHEISITNNNLYIRTSGLGFHVMGPWVGGGGNGLFNNYPGNTARAARFPLNPVVDSIPRAITGGGAIGYLVDGVSMFDSRDALSFRNDVGLDATPGGIRTDGPGDGVWNRNAFITEVSTFDVSNSHPLTDLLHHHAQPKGLRHLIGDSLDYDVTTNTYTEAPNGSHSPILGWNFDGFPIYGPYAYSNPLDTESGVRRMITGFQLRDGSHGSTDLSASGRTTIPTWITRNEPGVRTNPLSVTEYGPAVDSSAGGETFILGHYIEDHAYKGDLTNYTLYDSDVANNRPFNANTDFDLNEYNVRWCVTPEFPEGTWAYFICIDEQGISTFPFTMTRYYFGVLSGADEVNLPANREIIFEGGPEMTQELDSVEVDDASGDVTLTWSGIEGGTYRIERSNDLEEWAVLNDNAKTDSGIIGVEVDSARDLTVDQHFYRSALTSIDPFDDNGFDYTPPPVPTFIANFESLPPLSEITGVTVGGVPATIIGNFGSTLILNFDTTGIEPGSFPAIVSYTPADGSGPIQLSSTDTFTVTADNNILLVIVDDWGIDSSPIDNAGTAGASLPPMPNLEFLTQNGLRFTNAYAQPVCAPTRASIITGRHGYRNGVGHPSGSGVLPVSELTLPEVFAAEGSPYSLACIGKWHLGGGNGGGLNGPATIGGWPEFRGYFTNIDNYFNWEKVVNGTTTSNVSTYATTEQVNDTIDFIEDQTSPWFVWLAFSAPHSPYHNPPSDLHSYPSYPTNAAGTVTGDDRRGAYEASLEALDTELGRLLENVDLTKTNVILIGDNGTPGNVIQNPYNDDHSKDTLYEGGVRVPLIAIGPDIPQGTSSELVHCVDLFSTILELAKIDVASATSGVDIIDSQSLVPIFNGVDTIERCIVAERHTTTMNPDGTGRALRSDSHPNYKLIAFGDPTISTDTTTYEMYQIITDPNEQSPLSLPPAAGAPHFDAYQSLIAKDIEVGPEAALVSIFLELPTTPTGSQAVPGNLNIDPLSITIDGVTATFIDRADQNGDQQRYWIQCTLPAGATVPFTEAIVTFPENNNTPLGDRIFTAIQIIVVP